MVPPARASMRKRHLRELMEAGIVVRGHDIARVVGLMAGTDVEWREDAA